MAERNIIKNDRVRGMLQAIRVLTGEQLVVGIPADSPSRNDGEITNQELGYIHEFGAPGANIPPRPFLIPGTRKAIPSMLPRLKKACNFALDKKYAQAHRELVAAGVIAEQFIKREIMTGDFVPLKPGTIAARFRKRGVAGPSQREKRYLSLIGLGTSPKAAQSATGIRALLNTRQLYNAIRSVIRKVTARGPMSGDTGGESLVQRGAEGVENIAEDAGEAVESVI